LELDVIDMVYTDQFLGENFIKCFFRYYAEIPTYVKQVFLHLLKEDDPKLTEKIVIADDRFSLKVNLKLTNFPVSVEQVSA
jgi:hypothetical protein